MNKGILIVYNTCTIGGGENSAEWENNLSTIQRQNFDNFKVVVSECRGSVRDKPNMDIFVDKVNRAEYCYNIIYENLPVHITFNHSVREMVKRFGKFEYYMHITSGIGFTNQHDLQNIYIFLKVNDDIAVLILAAENDNVFRPDCGHDFNFILDKSYHMKPGYRVNQHCSIYSNHYYESYDEKIRPDIYVGNAIEPTFSYLTSAIGKKYVICPLSVCGPLVHKRTADGKGNPGISNRRWFVKFYTEKLNADGVLIDDSDVVIPFRERLEELGVFIDYPKDSGVINSNNPFLSDEQKEILENNFGEDGISTDEEYIKKLHKLLKKELFIQENEKIWIHKTSWPKTINDFEEKIFNYNDIDNKLIIGR